EFKKDDVLVQLDATLLQQDYDKFVREHDNRLRRLQVSFANDPTWLAAKKSLDDAVQAKADPAEIARRQDALDTLTSHADAKWIDAKELLEKTRRNFALGGISEDEFNSAQRAFDNVERTLRVARLDD